MLPLPIASGLWWQSLRGFVPSWCCASNHLWHTTTSVPPTISCDQSRVVWVPSSYNCSGQVIVDTTTRTRQCPRVVPITNGFAVTLSAFEGSVEKYTCNFGYQPRFETMLCSNGEWLGAICDLITTTATRTTTTTNPPTTTIPRCSFNPNVKNGKAYPVSADEGARAKVTCNNGYEHKNSKNSEIVCRQGQWTGDAMTCHKQSVEAGATSISTSTLPILILIIFQFFFNFWTQLMTTTFTFQFKFIYKLYCLYYKKFLINLFVYYYFFLLRTNKKKKKLL